MRLAALVALLFIAACSDDDRKCAQWTNVYMPRWIGNVMVMHPHPMCEKYEEKPAP